jgi:anti-sigma factor RsiW
MHEKMLNLLNAYMDNELTGARMTQLENHLEECPFCQAELDELRQVSRLLHAAPLPGFLPTWRVIANLSFKLPHRPVRGHPVGRTSIAWWMVPVGLLGLFFFVHTVFMITTMVSLADITGLLGNTAAWLSDSGQTVWFSTLVNLTGGQLGDAQTSVAALNDLGLLGHGILSNLVWRAAIFMLYAAWIASWLIQPNRNMVLGGSRPGHLNTWK